MWAIAENTFREALRNKILYIVAVFVLVMICSSAVLGLLTLEELDKVIKDLGLSAIQVLGLLVAIFVGVNLVYDELEQKTIYIAMANGAKRYEFIFGKFLGLLFTILFNMAAMAFVLLFMITVIPGTYFTISILECLFMFIFEVMIITSLAVLFSCFSSPIISAVCTFLMFIIGHLSEDLLSFGKIAEDKGYPIVKIICIGLYYLLPNLELFNLKNLVVYEKELHVDPIVIIYGLLYTFCMLLLTVVMFRRKDFR